MLDKTYIVPGWVIAGTLKLLPVASLLGAQHWEIRAKKQDW